MANYYVDLSASTNGNGTSNSPYNASILYALQSDNNYYLRGYHTVSADLLYDYSSVTPVTGTNLTSWDASQPWRLNFNNFDFLSVNYYDNNGISLENGIAINFKSYSFYNIDDCYIEKNTSHGTIVGHIQDSIIICDYSLWTPILPITNIYRSVLINRNPISEFNNVFNFGGFSTISNVITNAVTFSGAVSGNFVNTYLGGATVTNLLLSATTDYFSSAYTPNWLNSNLNSFTLGYRANCPAWAGTVLSNNDYYVDINSSASSGFGISASPYNYDQFRIILSGGSINYLSATTGDDLRIKGTRTVDFLDLDINPKGKLLKLTSWENKEPWKIDSELEPLYLGPYSITIEDAIFEPIVFLLDSSNDSQTLIFNNCIFYKKVETFSYEGPDNYDSVIKFQGCTFLGDILLDEYGPLISETHTSAYFNDCAFIDCSINSYVQSNGYIHFEIPFALISATSCIFTSSYSNISGGFNQLQGSLEPPITGSWYLTNCVYNWDTNGYTFPSYLNFTRSDVNFYKYNISSTFGKRNTFWSSNDLSYGFWNSQRIGPGAWDFADAYQGHIGAFYFGAISKIVSAGILEFTFNLDTSYVPTISGATAVFVTPSTLDFFFNTSDLTVNNYADILVDFIGIPRQGTSPLIVDFSATTTMLNNVTKNYYISEYIWYFDYDRDPTVSASTGTNATTSYTFSGHQGKQFTIRVVARATEL